MSKKPQERRNLLTEVHPVGRFAVMRHSSKSKSMHCSALHVTRDSAVTEAQRLTTEDVTEHGPGDTCYYVVEIVSRVGIIDGKLCTGA